MAGSVARTEIRAFTRGCLLLGLCLSAAFVGGCRWPSSGVEPDPAQPLRTGSRVEVSGQLAAGLREVVAEEGRLAIEAMHAGKVSHFGDLARGGDVLVE